MNMLYLNHIEEATKEDEDNQLVYWAKAFMAKTWEELKLIAKHNEVFREVGEDMYQVNAETIERQMAEAHRRYLETTATIRAEGYEDGVADMQAQLDAKDAELDASHQRIAELERLLAEKS